MAPTANCPVCRASLQLTNHGTFDSWICSAGHGLAATLSELYERAQDDEIHQLWHLAKSAPAGDRPCPMCERLMVKVTAPYDSDEAEEGTPGDGPAEGEVPVDVCLADQVIWFDNAELDQLPAGRPDPEPTAEQEAALEDIRRQWGEMLDQNWGGESTFADRTAERMGQSAQAFSLLSPTNAISR